MNRFERKMKKEFPFLYLRVPKLTFLCENIALSKELLWKTSSENIQQKKNLNHKYLIISCNDNGKSKHLLLLSDDKQKTSIAH